MTPIVDIDKYNSGMAKSMEDKLWFVEKLKDERIDIIVDYGCADGEMLLRLSEIYPDAELIGYDKEQEMVRKANARVKAWISDDWPEILSYCQGKHHILLIMSSVIHEIYSYCGNPNFTLFKALSINADFVAIRDMAYAHDKDRMISMSDYLNFTAHVNAKQAETFVKKYGELYHEKNFVHFLLKYRYTKNWKRELEENYVVITPAFVDKILSWEWNVQYMEFYTLPFLKEQVKKDFHIDLQEATHIKLLLSNVR